MATTETKQLNFLEHHKYYNRNLFQCSSSAPIREDPLHRGLLAAHRKSSADRIPHVHPLVAAEEVMEVNEHRSYVACDATKCASLNYPAVQARAVASLESGGAWIDYLGQSFPVVPTEMVVLI